MVILMSPAITEELRQSTNYTPKIWREGSKDLEKIANFPAPNKIEFSPVDFHELVDPVSNMEIRTVDSRQS